MKKIIKYFLAIGILIGLIIASVIGVQSYQKHQKLVQKQAAALKTPEGKLKNKIAHMALDNRIGQLFVSKTSGMKPGKVENDVKKYHLGGLLISSDAYQDTTKAEFKNQIKQYQKQAQLPLMIAADQEGGTVSRLDINPALTDTSSYPSPMEIYQAGGINNNVNWAKQTADDLKGLGFNWDFAPVADVTDNPDDFIYDRTLGQNYQTTAKYISKVVPAMQQQGVATAVKHFPGYGSAGDTHNGGASSNKTQAQIMNHDALPFKAAVKAGTDAIMVTHVVLNKIDPNRPASLSKKDIQLLRHNLQYQGVIITDSMQMGAVTDYAKKHKLDASVASVEAGNDVVLSNNYKQGIPAIKKAIRQGKISEKQLNESVYRVMRMKQKVGLTVD